MSAVYLFRHGQAGLRNHYDTLSMLGRGQARLLGEYLARSGPRFDAIYSGALQRQQETARAVAAAFNPAPEIIVDARWNEFDLSAVYAGIAPRIAEAEAAFRGEYEALQLAAANLESTVHRTWTPVDMAVMRAWIEGTHSYEGESWVDFEARIVSAINDLRKLADGEAVAVSTSATPIGICTGYTLGLPGRQAMRLAAVLLNASFTTFRVKSDDIVLFSFNNAPHLTEAGLRTFR